MPHRFPPLSPQVASPRKITARTGAASGFAFADLCFAAALVLSLALALI